MSKKLSQWIVVRMFLARKRWRDWTGKKSMYGWCCGDCLLHPINWDYERKEPK